MCCHNFTSTPHTDLVKGKVLRNGVVERRVARRHPHGLLLLLLLLPLLIGGALLLRCLHDVVVSVCAAHIGVASRAAHPKLNAHAK